MNKIINKAPLILISIFFVFISIVFSVYAQTDDCLKNLPSDREALERVLAECQRQIEAEERKLQQTQKERIDTEYQILVIQNEINKALLRVKESDLAIYSINKDIVDREESNKVLSEKITRQREVLKDLFRKTHETEQAGLLPVILSEATISNFFSKVSDYESIRFNIEDSIRDIEILQNRLRAGLESLEERKTEKETVRVSQKIAANQVQEKRAEKEVVLNQQLKEEKTIESGIDARSQRIAEIQNRLFELRGIGPISFENALNIAQNAQRLTGIRPAFLLGLIKHESDLGKNVGTGSWRVDMHPTRDAPIFPYITKALGIDPDEIKVSANPGFGWGGAMGPAQFIPSTWVCYGGFVNTKSGTCSKNVNLIRGTAILKVGSRGLDVKRLQQFLNQNGFKVASTGPGSPGKETTLFGEATAQAVSRFQERYSNRILEPYYSRGTGQLGPKTRNAVNELNFYSGPWKYDPKKDKIRQLLKSNRVSNPWNAIDALTVSAMYLSELGGTRDECVAARKYYAGGNWRTQVALNYCRAVLANAQSFQRDIDYLNQ